MKYYDTNDKFDLNSRSIREIVFNLHKCNFRMDPICDQFIDYILENYEHVSGDTVEKVCAFPRLLQVTLTCSVSDPHVLLQLQLLP